MKEHWLIRDHIVKDSDEGTLVNKRLYSDEGTLVNKRLYSEG